MTLYTDRKPREAVARAIYEAAPNHTILWTPPDGLNPTIITGRKARTWDEATEAHAGAFAKADAALNTLRELGFITSEGLDAIHAEEDANGEPRSSVVPGERR